MLPTRFAVFDARRDAVAMVMMVDERDGFDYERERRRTGGGDERREENRHTPSRSTRGNENFESQGTVWRNFPVKIGQSPFERIRFSR